MICESMRDSRIHDLRRQHANRRGLVKRRANRRARAPNCQFMSSACRCGNNCRHLDAYIRMPLARDWDGCCQERRHVGRCGAGGVPQATVQAVSVHRSRAVCSASRIEPRAGRSRLSGAGGRAKAARSRPHCGSCPSTGAGVRCRTTEGGDDPRPRGRPARRPAPRRAIRVRERAAPSGTAGPTSQPVPDFCPRRICVRQGPEETVSAQVARRIRRPPGTATDRREARVLFRRTRACDQPHCCCPGPAGTTSSGSSRVFCQLNRQSRCGPVLRPVDPTAATMSPFRTRSPRTTAIADR